MSLLVCPSSHRRRPRSSVLMFFANLLLDFRYTFPLFAQFFFSNRFDNLKEDFFEMVKFSASSNVCGSVAFVAKFIVYKILLKYCCFLFIIVFPLPFQTTANRRPLCLSTAIYTLKLEAAVLIVVVICKVRFNCSSSDHNFSS